MLGGKEKTVKIPVDFKQLQYWDIQKKKYFIEKGKYIIETGTSSDNLYLKNEIFLKE